MVCGFILVRDFHLLGPWLLGWYCCRVQSNMTLTMVVRSVLNEVAAGMVIRIGRPHQPKVGLHSQQASIERPIGTRHHNMAVELQHVTKLALCSW